MRLIDAEALGNEVLEEYGADGGSNDVNVIYGMIINAPTVNIVQCKDCTHYNISTHGCKRNPCVEPWEENDFCSYGENI